MTQNEKIILNKFKVIGRHKYNSLNRALKKLNNNCVDDILKFKKIHKMSVSTAEKEILKYEEKNKKKTPKKVIEYFSKLGCKTEINTKTNYTYLDFKKEMWRKFQKAYFKQNGVNYSAGKIYINNLKPIFYYFLGDYENFIKCENVLKSTDCVPNLNKGLLIIGDFGNGKTSTLKAFSEVTKGTKKHFKVIGSKEVVTQYSFFFFFSYKQEKFYTELVERNYLIDDILKESFASSYGKINLIEQIVEEKYRNKSTLHATLNYAVIDGITIKNVKTAVEQIGDKYGGYIYDRVFSMFNIIEFNGKSLR